MADNIYLLETRLSKAQQAALAAVREVARARGLTVFLVGGAVRDLIGGTAVRDLDVVVQGNALKLKKDIEKAGGAITGEVEPGQAFFVRFPGGVRMEIGSTLTVTYPKPGRAVYKPATILDDLRRRDFTANAMALSLNEGSYGLLMDPLNGVADIENRELRLVSNYGFIEDPVRMIRAARYMARLGWRMDEKTQARYETGKAEGYISAMDDFHRGYETEEIFHEEDPLRVIRRLEEEGWMQHLAPALSAEKANVPELERLRESQAQLQIQGVVAESAAANFPLITAKMAAKDVESLKKSFPRQGFVADINGLEAKGREFAAQLGAKGASQPSQAYRLITQADPEAVLWVAHTTKSAALQAKFRSFYTEWPQARQRIPYVQMQEMRITPELPGFEQLVERLFFELMDGRLGTAEEMKAFLEPYSPPAPPPPISLRRPRAPKKDAKPPKSRKKVVDAAADESTPVAEGVEGMPAEQTTGAAAVFAGVVSEDGAPKSERPARAGAAKPGAAKAGAAKAETPGKVSPGTGHAATDKSAQGPRQAAGQDTAKGAGGRAKEQGKVPAKVAGKAAGKAVAAAHPATPKKVDKVAESRTSAAKGKGAAKATTGTPAKSALPKGAGGSAAKGVAVKAPVKKTAQAQKAAAKKGSAKQAAPAKSAKKAAPANAGKSAKKAAPSVKGSAAKPTGGSKAGPKKAAAKPVAKKAAVQKTPAKKKR